MTLYGAISNLVMMREHPMMPSMFYSSLDKIIETVSECDEPETNSSEFPNGWIPTSKERPPQHQEIWITSDLGDVELVYGKGGIWLLDENYYTEPEIIAWMPANVPSPYQPKEDES